jgi:hypothetical protein
MQEKVWRLAVQLPEGVASTPERMLLVNPLAFALVLLRTWGGENLYFNTDT